jgi:hypothetical protein
MRKSKLEKEFQYYIEHQEELVKKYQGKFIVIMNCEVIGAFDTELSAIQETMKTHLLGSFLVQECRPGKDNYTQTYHSRVMVG